MATNEKILANIIKTVMNEDNDPLSPLIDKYLIRRRDPKYAHLRLDSHEIDTQERPRPLGRLSPSSLCGCHRQAALKFLGVRGKKKVDPDLENIFDDGHWRHHKWQFRALEMERILGKENFRCYAIEMPVRMEKIRVAGHLDILVGIRSKGEMVKWVIDIKGINSFGFQDVFAKQQPRFEHVEQLISYMKAKRVRRGILLYEDKNSNRYICFTVIFDPEQWKVVKRWCRKTLDYVECQEVPPMHPECKNGTFLYEKCEFKALCFGGKTQAQLEQLAYKDFTSVEDLWVEGLRIEEEA